MRDLHGKAFFKAIARLLTVIFKDVLQRDGSHRLSVNSYWLVDPSRNQKWMKDFEKARL